MCKQLNVDAMIVNEMPASWPPKSCKSFITLVIVVWMYFFVSAYNTLLRKYEL